MTSNNEAASMQSKQFDAFTGNRARQSSPETGPAREHRYEKNRCESYAFTPALRRIVIIGHQLVKPDWNKFKPTKAVNRNQYGLTQ